MDRQQIWTLCKIAAGVIIILTFTPLVTPAGRHTPSLMGMPYLLWVGILDSLLLVGITWIGTRVHPGRNE